MARRVGVVSIQGDFEKHVAALRRCKLPGLHVSQVRTPEDLREVDCAILPGGESTTVGLLMERYGLGDALREAAAAGMPIWGTCMGLILLAHDVEDRDQYTLDLLDVTVRRNAFGSQVHSFEDHVQILGLDAPVLGVFIRAPVVSRLGPGVEATACYDGQIVAVRQGSIVGTSFHPELTTDTRFHRWFVSL